MVNNQHFSAVNGRCAVDMKVLLTQLLGKYDDLHVLEILSLFDLLNIGYSPIDLVAVAGSMINTAVYRSGARVGEAPDVFDCSSFTKWCYARVGIWLPRLAVQQYGCGIGVPVDEARPGDLVFFTGPLNCWIDSPENGVGHVGIYVGYNRVVHATRATGCVTQSSLSKMMSRRRETRGARRLIREASETLVLKIPPELEIERSDDILWLIRRTLAKGFK